jgi:hypothetical protein
MEVQDDRAGAYDSNNPPKLLSWQLQFVLASTNPLRTASAPVFSNSYPTNLTMYDYATLLVTNAATTTGTNLTLTYGLLEPPAWASINTNTGVITLTPGQCDGHSTNVITTIVTDNGNPPDRTTNSFTLIVIEVNTAPFWPELANTPTNQTAIALSNLTFDASAQDTNCQPDLTYGLTSTVTVANLPVSNFTNGLVTWTPDQAQSPSTNIFTVIATNYDQYAPTNQYLTATSLAR